jgi:hypothetical protein
MRSVLALLSLSLLLAACTNPFQPAPGTPDGEGDGEGYGGTSSMSSSASVAPPAAMERVDVNAKAEMGE